MNKISHDSETPAQGKQVITACAFIHQQFDGVEKVFLPKRAATKKFLPNINELPGGHIEFGEDIVAGLKREIQEEFEMQTSVGDPFFVFTYNNPIKGSHSIEVVYFAKFVDPIENIVIHPEDHSEYGWYSFEELENKNILIENRDKDDPETKAILKGFELLKEFKLNFG